MTFGKINPFAPQVQSMQAIQPTSAVSASMGGNSTGESQKNSNTQASGNTAGLKADVGPVYVQGGIAGKKLNTYA